MQSELRVSLIKGGNTNVTIIFSGTFLAQRWWRAFWIRLRLQNFREMRNAHFHHDYFENIWKLWDKDIRGIELRYGIRPVPGSFRFTNTLEFKHPENISPRFTEVRS